MNNRSPQHLAGSSVNPTEDERPSQIKNPFHTPSTRPDTQLTNKLISLAKEFITIPDNFIFRRDLKIGSELVKTLSLPELIIFTSQVARRKNTKIAKFAYGGMIVNFNIEKDTFTISRNEDAYSKKNDPNIEKIRLIKEVETFSMTKYMES